MAKCLKHCYSLTMSNTDDSDLLGLDYDEGLDDLDPLRAPQTVSRWSTDWTTETIASQIAKGNIDLAPRFQRREAWTWDKQSRFIESLILGLPVPQIILAERKDDPGRFIVIDGKQRLLSLSNFYGLDPDPVIGGLILTGLKNRDDLNGHNYPSMKDNPQLRREMSTLENQPIRTVILGHWGSDDYLYEVFLRINTGGTPLSPQELRQALHPGPFADFIDRFSVRSNVLKSLLGLKEPDFRMRDVELVLRYYSYRNFASDYRGNLKKFLDGTLLLLNHDFGKAGPMLERQATEFEEAILAAEQIFGKENAMRKWTGERYERQLNRAVFDIMAYYFSFEDWRNRALGNPENVKHAFENLCVNDERFKSAIESTTKSIGANTARFAGWAAALSAAIGTDVRSPFAAP